MKESNGVLSKTVVAVLCILLLSTTAFSQNDLDTAHSMIRNLVCLIYWVMPFTILLFFGAGSFLILTGGVRHRNTGKRFLINSVTALIILLVLMLFISLAIPSIDLRICFGAVPVVENQPPIAEARTGYTYKNPTEKRVEITLGDSAFFDGSMSTDADGIVVDYLWDFGDGAQDTGIFVEHNYSKIGEYYASLRVKDDKGEVCRLPSTVRVVVNPPLTANGKIGPPQIQPTTTSSLPEVTITVPGTATTSTSSTTTSTTSTTVPVKLTLIFVAVDWAGSLPSSFDSAVDVQAQEIINNIPLKTCPSAVKVIKVDDKVCNVGMPATESGCNSQAGTILNKIENCAKAEGVSYDYAIGLADQDFCGNWLGFSGGKGTVYTETGSPMVAVHELGHEWGLNDEYVDACRCGFSISSANCLDATLGGADPAGGYTSAACAGGSQCPGYTITCMGNKNPSGGRCLMSFANAPSPRVYCKYCWDHLLTIPKLQC